MSVKTNDLKRIVNNFLNLMEKEEVKSMLDYEQPEKRFPVPDKPNDYISVEFRPSSNTPIPLTNSPTISYHAGGGGIPLEVRINSNEGYSRIILKTVEGVIPNYSPFAIDIFDNIGQNKIIKSTDVADVKKELKNILEFLKEWE